MDRIYLSEAKLKGYRTIKDLSVKFNPGLNIIIGKNGSGKTNFLTYLDKAITYDYNDIFNSITYLKFDGRINFEVNVSKDATLGNLTSHSTLAQLGNIKAKYELKINGDEIEPNYAYQNLTSNNELNFNSIFITHGIRSNDNNFIIASPFSFEYLNFVNELFPSALNRSNPFFLRSVLFDLSMNLFEFEEEKLLLHKNTEYIQQFVLKSLNYYCDYINESIGEYLPIERIRISSSLKVYKEQDSIKVDNIILEYYVNNFWLPFSSLSDGTKRMFCIYSDVIATLSLDDTLPANDKIILLEEPELGIHPHQFEQIMTFLKKMSKDVQIILTTHSPQALDILSKDELDALHICEYHPETGTTLTSLSEGQIDKAKAYMDSEMYLSDYWRYSDLEK
ncbi:AAA family ATPase [Mucilaginibacter terrae]|uniref:AAA family ATPase n=1 Tax=Mucilaginibacter terrae TaxID=1955052 RepID=UPI00362D6397